MTPALEEQASAFARTLTEVCRSTVASTADFAFQKLEGSAVGWVAQSGTTTPARPALIPLDGTAASPLWLRVRFTVGMDSVDEFLAIEASTFGLCINDETGRCAIRIEYERGRGSEPDGDEDARRHSRPAAHVHVHGASPELGYVWGALGRPLRSLDKLHIPVGGGGFVPPSRISSSSWRRSSCCRRQSPAGAT